MTPGLEGKGVVKARLVRHDGNFILSEYLVLRHPLLFTEISLNPGNLTSTIEIAVALEFLRSWDVTAIEELLENGCTVKWDGRRLVLDLQQRVGAGAFHPSVTLMRQDAFLAKTSSDLIRRAVELRHAGFFKFICQYACILDDAGQPRCWTEWAEVSEDWLEVFCRTHCRRPYGAGRGLAFLKQPCAAGIFTASRLMDDSRIDPHIVARCLGACQGELRERLDYDAAGCYRDHESDTRHLLRQVFAGRSLRVTFVYHHIDYKWVNVYHKIYDHIYSRNHRAMTICPC